MSKSSPKKLFTEIVQSVLNGKVVNKERPYFNPTIETHPHVFPVKSIADLKDIGSKKVLKHTPTGEEVSMVYKSLNPYITIKNFVSPFTPHLHVKSIDILFYLEKYGIVSISKMRHPTLFTFDQKYHIVFKNIDYSKSYYRDIQNNLNDGRLLPVADSTMINNKSETNDDKKTGNPSFSSFSNSLSKYVLNFQESQHLYHLYMNNLLNAFESEDKYHASLIKKWDPQNLPHEDSLNSSLDECINDINAFHDIEKKSCLLRTTLPPDSLNYRKIPSILWQYDIKNVFPLKWTDPESFGDSIKDENLTKKNNLYYICFNNNLDSERFMRNFHGLKLSNHQLLVDPLSFV